MGPIRPPRMRGYHVFNKGEVFLSSTFFITSGSEGFSIFNMPCRRDAAELFDSAPVTSAFASFNMYITLAEYQVVTEAMKVAMSRTPLGRLGEAREIADAVAFLVSDKSSYITGETIYVDGGRLGLNYTV